MSTHFATAEGQISRIGQLCDFLDSPAVEEMITRNVPVSMIPDVGSLGFDISLWVGLGMVGLWSALDASAEREPLAKKKCPTCHSQGCLSSRLTSTGKLSASFETVLGELEDVRHLYAHNFAGRADTFFYKRRRHVLQLGANVTLSCGAIFTGENLSLRTAHLRFYVNQLHSIVAALQ